MTIRHSFGQVGRDLAAILQTRAEIFSVEFAAQRERFFSLLCLFGCIFTFLVLALVISSIFFISLFWPGEFRYWAIGWLALTYALIGLSLLWTLVRRLKTEALPFEVTRNEFANDLALLSAWQQSKATHADHNGYREDTHER